MSGEVTDRPADAPLRKLLSHRARGFSRFEHSPLAFEAACRSGVPYLEVDTRVTADGRIVLQHDPRLDPGGGPGLEIARSPYDVVARARTPDGQPLLTLERALETFRELASPDQTLCLDVKDCGFEAEHLRAVRDAGLRDRVVFVSWVPQVLLRLGELGAAVPLVLSHWNLARLGLPGAGLARALRDVRLRLGRGLLVGARAALRKAVAAAHGYQHWLVCRELPPVLASLLARSGGGVCVPRFLMAPGLAAYCESRGLKLWLYSAAGTRDFLDLASDPAVDVVFCDDAQTVLEDLTPYR